MKTKTDFDSPVGVSCGAVPALSGPPTSSAGESSFKRRCSACKKIKPLEEFGRDKTCKYGRRYSCYVCTRERDRAAIEKNPEKFRARGRAWRNKNPKSAAASTLKWRAANAEKVKATRRRYYWRNKERSAKLHREWAAKHREQINETQNKKYHASPEQTRAASRLWREQNLERARQNLVEWKKKNPEKVSAIRHRRRAWSLSAPGADYTTAKHIKWRWEMWGNRCWICGGKAAATDHVIALASGGSHWPANLRPICKPCNSRKGAKSHKEFLDLDKHEAPVIKCAPLPDARAAENN